MMYDYGTAVATKTMKSLVQPNVERRKRPAVGVGSSCYARAVGTTPCIGTRTLTTTAVVYHSPNDAVPVAVISHFLMSIFPVLYSS